MERRDPALFVAVGIFGIVLTGICVVATLRMADAPDFLPALRGTEGDSAEYSGEDWEGCNSLAIISGIYDSAGDDISGSTYDHHSETQADSHRSSSLRVITYGNSSRAGAIMADRQRAANEGRLAECLAALENSTSGKRVEPVLTGDAAVGWAMVFTYDGRPNRREFLSWVEDDRLVNLELIGPDEVSTAEWMRDEYARVTTAIARP